MTAGRAERDSGLRAWADEIELAAQGLLSGPSAQVQPYGITNAACCTGAERIFIVTFDQPTDFAEITGIVGTLANSAPTVSAGLRLGAVSCGYRHPIRRSSLLVCTGALSTLATSGPH